MPAPAMLSLSRALLSRSLLSAALLLAVRVVFQ
jgi:hypothetical protein